MESEVIASVIHLTKNVYHHAPRRLFSTKDKKDWNARFGEMRLAPLLTQWMMMGAYRLYFVSLEWNRKFLHRYTTSIDTMSPPTQDTTETLNPHPTTLPFSETVSIKNSWSFLKPFYTVKDKWHLKKSRRERKRKLETMFWACEHGIALWCKRRRRGFDNYRWIVGTHSMMKMMMRRRTTRREE